MTYVVWGFNSGTWKFWVFSTRTRLESNNSLSSLLAR